MPISTQKVVQEAPQTDQPTEAWTYFKTAKNSAALLAGAALSASAYLGYSYASNIKDNFEALSQYIRESGAYKATVDAGGYSAHFGRRLKNAEESGLLYQAVPVAVGTYFGFLGVQKLIEGIFGYDSVKMRKEFIDRAYSGVHNKQVLSTSERISYLSRATFGSINSGSRAYVFVEGAARLLIAAALIYPIFLKDHSETPDTDEIKFNNMQMRQAQHEANVGGYSRAQTLRTSKDLFYGGLSQPWEQSISKGSIDANAQKFASDILDAPTGVPTFSDSLKSGLKSSCDWTLGFTQFADQCEILTPPKPEKLFSTNADGTTLIDKAVLEKTCRATQEFIASDPSIDSFSTQVRRQLDSVCSYINSTSCQAFKEWALPGNGTEPRKELATLTKRVCDVLETRARYQSLFTYKPFTSEVSTSYRLGQMLKTSGLLEAITRRPEHARTSYESPLISFCDSNPESYKNLVRGFYSASESELTSAKAIKGVTRKFALDFHPDKFRGNKEIATEIFRAGEILRDSLTRCSIHAGHASQFFTLTELADQVANYFKYEG
ncbi:MAG: hypothetical protein S4CHLAM6_14640 [Chlamydiae bacterium]|nr:hypothetical protein [Chlamydiota bacterium]